MKFNTINYPSYNKPIPKRKRRKQYPKYKEVEKLLHEELERLIISKILSNEELENIGNILSTNTKLAYALINTYRNYRIKMREVLEKLKIAGILHTIDYNKKLLTIHEKINDDLYKELSSKINEIEFNIQPALL